MFNFLVRNLEGITVKLKNFIFNENTNTVEISGNVKFKDLNRNRFAYIDSDRNLSSVTLGTINGNDILDGPINVGTVTSVGLTTGTSGTDINVTGSPVTGAGSFTLNIPTASATNRGALSSADWTLFNGKPAGSGAANKVTFWSGTNTLSSNSNFHWDNANERLGIGAVSPRAKLHTYLGGGSATNGPTGTTIIGQNSLAGNSSYLTLVGAYNAEAGIIFTDESEAYKGKIGYNNNLEYLYFNTDGSEIIRILSNGNVGIGLTTPQAKLEVNADILVNSNTIGYGNGNLDSNIAFGHRALINNTTGQGNVAIGKWALESNTTQSDNFAIGRGNLRYSTGNTNMAIGNGCMTGTVTGLQNVAIGNAALTQLTTGVQNVGIGSYAMNIITAGNYNVAIGASSGASITTGSQNFALGSLSLQSVTTQNGNVAIGAQAQRFATGNFNITIGNALMANTTTNSHVSVGGLSSLTSGLASTAVGTSSLESVTTGSYNTALGYRTGFQGNGSNNIFIGNYAGAYETGSYRLHIGSSENFTEASGRAKSIIYGEMNFTEANQILNLNAKVKATYKPNVATHLSGYDTDGYFANVTLGNNLSIESGILDSNEHWYSINSDQTLAIGKNYLIKSGGLVRGTLPTTAPVGSKIRVAGAGDGPWEIRHANGCKVILNSVKQTTATVSGAVQSIDNYDAVELMCITANTDWLIISHKGSIDLI